VKLVYPKIHIQRKWHEIQRAYGGLFLCLLDLHSVFVRVIFTQLYQLGLASILLEKILIIQTKTMF
jgi:hypothetical protein